MKNYLMILFLVLPLLVNCKDDTTTTIIRSCTSPKGKYTANFYIEASGGAAGSQYEFLSISEKGNIKKYEIMKIKCGYDLSLHWVEEDKLEIGYPEDARIDHWQSFFGSDYPGGISWLKKIPAQGGLFIDNSLGGCK